MGSNEWLLEEVLGFVYVHLLLHYLYRIWIKGCFWLSLSLSLSLTHTQSSVANGNPWTKTLSFGFNISFRKLNLVTCANSAGSISHSNWLQHHCQLRWVAWNLLIVTKFTYCMLFFLTLTFIFFLIFSYYDLI